MSILKEVYVPAYVVLADYLGIVEIPQNPQNLNNFQSSETFTPSPLATAVSQQNISRYQSVSTFINSENLRHFRTLICSKMDELYVWEMLLRARGLLGGEGMEVYVSKLKNQWENNRGGDPTLTILSELVRTDKDFGSMDLSAFSENLKTFNIKSVNDELDKLTTWLNSQSTKIKEKSETSYVVQSDLRSWLLKNNICDTSEVDILIPRLQREGVKNIDTIRGFSKEDLKACGFKTAQAIATINALKQ